MNTESQEAILQEVADFAEAEIVPNVNTYDQEGRIPQSLLDQLAKRGYLGANLPAEYGGLALDPLYFGRLTGQIGKACPSVRSLLTVHSSLVGESILRFGTEEQKGNYLPKMAKGSLIAAFALSEPETGSDAANIRTAYKKSGDGFLINGQKKWITMGTLADLFLVFARDGETLSAFLIPADSPGVTITPITGLMAAKSSHIAEITFEEVVVPKENLLGKEGIGFSYIVNTALDHGRFSVAWGGQGMAEAALEAMVRYARKRKQFGQGLYNHQLIQGIIAEATTKVAAGRAMCMRAGQLRTELDPEATIETTIAKYYTSKIANEIASEAIQVHGGNGISENYPVERLFREAKILEIIEGTTQLLQTVISTHGLNKHYKR